MKPVWHTLPTPWGPWPLASASALLALAWLCGWYLLRRRHAALGCARPRLAWAYLGVAAALLAGALLGRWLLCWRWGAGLASAGITHQGALEGACFVLPGALWLGRRWLRTAPQAWLAAWAPVLLLGWAAAALGAWLAGVDAGAMQGAWAPEWLQSLGRYPRLGASGSGGGMVSGVVATPVQVPAWWHWLLAHRGQAHQLHTPALHPIGLYRAGVALLLLLFVELWGAMRRPLSAGMWPLVCGLWCGSEWLWCSVADPQTPHPYGASWLCLAWLGFGAWQKRAQLRATPT